MHAELLATIITSVFVFLFNMSMITATAWVPRGFAAQFPTKYDFDEEEFSRISKLAKRQLDDAKEDLDEAQQTAASKNGKTNGASNGAVSAIKTSG